MLKKFAHVRRYEQTNDVLQNALIRLLRSLETIRPTSTADFFGLAGLHLRRELLDLARYYRHLRRQPETANDANSEIDPLAQVLDPAETPEELDRWCAFHENVELLPTEQCEVVGLIFYNGWTQVHVAELLGISVRTVRRCWEDAMERLHTVAGTERVTGSNRPANPGWLPGGRAHACRLQKQEVYSPYRLPSDSWPLRCIFPYSLHQRLGATPGCDRRGCSGDFNSIVGVWRMPDHKVPNQPAQATPQADAGADRPTGLEKTEQETLPKVSMKVAAMEAFLGITPEIVAPAAEEFDNRKCRGVGAGNRISGYDLIEKLGQAGHGGGLSGSG